MIGMNAASRLRRAVPPLTNRVISTTKNTALGSSVALGEFLSNALAESAVAEPLLVELGVAALSRWTAWLAALPAPVFFQREGTLVGWHAAAQAEAVLFQRRVMASAPSVRPVSPRRMTSRRAS